MKKKSLMLILILAFLGCVLIGFSIYFLYQESFVANEKTEKATKELERANKKIEKLTTGLVNQPDFFRQECAVQGMGFGIHGGVCVLGL